MEWAALPDDRADALLADPAIEPYRHHLRSERRYRPHLLSEPEEKVLTEKAVTGRSAWVRLFQELVSTGMGEKDAKALLIRAGFEPF